MSGESTRYSGKMNEEKTETNNVSCDESKEECSRPKLCPRGHWRPAEDEKLRLLVEQYGPQNWNSIAEKLQGRSGTSSCQLHIIMFFLNLVWF